MGACISKCMPKRAPCSQKIHDKLVVSELPKLAVPELPSTSPPPPISPAGRKSPFSDEFLMACAKQNLLWKSHLVSAVMKPADALRSKAPTESTATNLESNCQKIKQGHVLRPQQSDHLKRPEKVPVSASCPSRSVATPELDRNHRLSGNDRKCTNIYGDAGCTTSTSYASNMSTNCSGNLNVYKNSPRVDEEHTISVPSSCGSRCGVAPGRMGMKRSCTLSNLASSSGSNGRASSACSSSACGNGCGGGTGIVRRKEICRHEVRIEHGKAGSGIVRREGNGRFLKRKKSEKVVHPMGHEDYVQSETSANIIDVADPEISLDCFIFL